LPVVASNAKQSSVLGREVLCQQYEMPGHQCKGLTEMGKELPPFPPAFFF